MSGPVWHSLLEFGVGSVEIVLGVVVVFELRYFGKRLPWLAVLMAFFLLRGADRIYVSFHGTDPNSITTTVDGVLILVLVFMLVGLRRTVQTLELLDQEARWRQEEYDRALLDFRRLVRHRLANPLTAITGALSTLEALPDIEPELRADLLRAAQEAAERLQDVALDPEVDGPEERELTARPRERTTFPASGSGKAGE